MFYETYGNTIEYEYIISFDDNHYTFENQITVSEFSTITFEHKNEVDSKVYIVNSVEEVLEILKQFILYTGRKMYHLTQARGL